LRKIQRSDQKLLPFRNGTLVSIDDTSYSAGSDSTSTTRKMASGNSCKNLKAIQRSDQKLWPFRTSTMVSSDETSALPRCDSTSTPRKKASRNSCKNLRAIQRSDEKFCPFETVLWYRSTIPPTHLVAIPHLLQGKRLPESPVKI